MEASQDLPQDPPVASTMQLTLGIAALVLLLDQLSKWLIQDVVLASPGAMEITGFFNLVLVYNRGVSFGFLDSDAAWTPWALGFLALAISAALLIWAKRQPGRFLGASIGLIVGGALGNAIDRMHQPGVVDFLDFHLGNWHWPAFNLADSAIAVGAALLVFDGLFLERHRSKTK